MAKILIVSNILLPPINAGSKKCMMSYISLLKEMGNEVFFLYVGKDSDVNITNASNYWGESFIYFRYSFLLRAVNLIKRIISKFPFRSQYSIGYYYPVWGLGTFVKKQIKIHQIDNVIVNYIWMTDLFKQISGVRKLLFTHDCFTNKNERVHNEMYSLTPNQEERGLKRCDIILSIQEIESCMFRFLAPSVPVFSVYMPIPYCKTAVCDSKNVLFFSGDNEVNMNGISSFIENVFDDLLRYDDTIRLVIGGGICKRLQAKYNSSNIIYEGYIDDVKIFYRHGDVVVNPVYQGTGLKIKTLEGISFGKIVIAHSHSIEGLYKQGGAPVIVVNSSEEYTRAIIKYIGNNTIALEMKKSCEVYINEMNAHIISQYKQIGF